jgi:predicted glycosyltransferase
VTGRVFFYVQSLLGLGHVVRGMRIAHALRERGFVVDLALGGRPISGLEANDLNIVQLTPVKAGAGGFSDLVTLSGQSAGPELKATRRRELLTAFADRAPDVLLIETFPFGRRQMRFELIPLLETAHARRPRPLVVSSIRDILQENRKPSRSEETIEVLRHYFDHVIIHGAPEFVRLEATFPLAHQIASMTSYSGLIGPNSLGADGAGSHTADVVAWAGGGAVGRLLLEAAVLAKPRTTLAASRWLVVTGPNVGAADFAQLKRLALQNDVRLERFVANLPRVLQHAQLAISQAGYNSVADVLSARCRAVLTPYAEHGETEQSRRAALLEERGLAVVVSETELTPDTLAAAVDRALVAPNAAVALDLGGATRTADILESLLRRRPG